MRSDSRAVSEVLGYALVFSLVITTVAIVSVAGVSELQDTRDTEQINNAERAFDLLSTNMNDIAKRAAPSRSTEMRLAEAQLSVADPVDVRFRGIENNTSPNNFSAAFEVWPITYESANGDSKIVYSGGSVFRTQGDSGIAVRETAIVATNDRLVVPLVQTRSRSAQGIGGGTVRVRATRSETALVASDTDSTFDTVFMNVTSPRASIWQETLSEYDGFSCTLDTSGSTDRVWCEASNPERVHISVTRIDVSLTS